MIYCILIKYIDLYSTNPCLEDIFWPKADLLHFRAFMIMRNKENKNKAGE